MKAGAKPGERAADRAFEALLACALSYPETREDHPWGEPVAKVRDKVFVFFGREDGDAPEVDGCVCVSSEEPLYPGQFYDVLVEDSDLYDLYGTVVK